MKIFTAVEIGYNRFKIMEICKKGFGYFLNNFINLAVDGLNYKDTRTASISLNKIFSENKINKKNVLTSINGNLANSYNFILPNMPASDLKLAVEYELKKVLPFPISRCIFDYIYTEKNGGSENGTLLNVTAFAAKDEDINNFKNIFDVAGIKIKSIECKTVAVYNSIRYLKKNKTGHLLVCDIGHKTVKIVIILNNSINFERTADGLNLEIQNSIESSDIVAGELKRTIDFYFAGKSLPPIDEIILTGIFSGKKGFDAKISEAVMLRAYSVSLLNLITSEKYSFYLSKKLKNRGIEDYEFFRPLDEMWTTFGLIVNR